MEVNECPSDVTRGCYSFRMARKNPLTAQGQLVLLIIFFTKNNNVSNNNTYYSNPITPEITYNVFLVKKKISETTQVLK